MAEENLYKWTDNPTVSGVAKCDTDVLNDCLMHLKYENENPNILKTNQITNCLLEVPQRIKLELKDGVLTLKAGSEVIVPNGFEEDGVTPKFDYVKFEEDKTCITYAVGKSFILINKNNDLYSSVTEQHQASGTAEPSGFIGIFYNTELNKVGYRSDATKSFTYGYALPLGWSTNISTTECSSIDQVFNGMGYIGSTVWVDKDIKCLAPNGRNADGTLNNVEIVTKKISMFTQTNNASYIPFVITSAGRVESAFGNVHDDIANINSHGVVCHVGRYTTTAEGGITYFAPNQPFRAAEYSSVLTLAERTNFYVKERYANGYSWYRLWNDGYLEQGGITGSAPGRVPARTVTFIKPFTSGLVSIVTNGAFGGSSNNPYMSFFQITGATVNNFTAYARCDENIQMYWVARGYA